MKRKFPIAGYVRDVDGTRFDVRDVRTTKYGFDLLFGVPAEDHGAYRGGLPRLIATKALREFWEKHRILSRGVIFDLPAGRTTLKRVRRRLGFNYVDDMAEFWWDRIGDLESMPSREFAAKHGVDKKVAMERRTQMVGKRARRPGWWRTPRVRRILLSNLTLREMGERLDISISQAARLRNQVKQELAAPRPLYGRGKTKQTFSEILRRLSSGPK